MIEDCSGSDGELLNENDDTCVTSTPQTLAVSSSVVAVPATNSENAIGADGVGSVDSDDSDDADALLDLPVALCNHTEEEEAIFLALWTWLTILYGVLWVVNIIDYYGDVTQRESCQIGLAYFLVFIVLLLAFVILSGLTHCLIKYLQKLEQRTNLSYSCVVALIEFLIFPGFGRCFKYFLMQGICSSAAVAIVQAIVVSGLGNTVYENLCGEYVSFCLMCYAVSLIFVKENVNAKDGLMIAADADTSGLVPCIYIILAMLRKLTPHKPKNRIFICLLWLVIYILGQSHFIIATLGIVPLLKTRVFYVWDFNTLTISSDISTLFDDYSVIDFCDEYAVTCNEEINGIECQTVDTNVFITRKCVGEIYPQSNATDVCARGTASCSHSGVWEMEKTVLFDIYCITSKQSCGGSLSRLNKTMVYGNTRFIASQKGSKLLPWVAALNICMTIFVRLFHAVEKERHR